MTKLLVTARHAESTWCAGRSLAYGLVLLVCPMVVEAAGAEDSGYSAETTSARDARLKWWTDSRFGLFIHFGLYSIPARHEWVKSIEQMEEKAYDRYFDLFDPDLFDAREWARRAKAAGMRYAVLTTKHHDGFCLFDSKLTDYKSTKTPFGRDVVREFADAFRAEGLRVGFYYSLPDWHHPEFPVDRYHPRRPNRLNPWAQNGTEGPEEPWVAINRTRSMAKYREYVFGQVRELLTNYGKVDLMWFDFTMPGPRTKHKEDWDGDRLLALVRELRPGIIVNDRLDVNGEGLIGDFITPEQEMQTSWPVRRGARLPWEMCQTFSGSWGYARDESTWKSDFEIIHLLVSCVAHGGNLILNVGPTARGTFDRRANAKLDMLAEWMRFNSASVYGCTEAPSEFSAPEGTVITYNPKTNRLYVHLLQYNGGDFALPFANRVGFASFLHDRSEIVIKGSSLVLPVQRPDVVIPVVECSLISPEWKDCALRERSFSKSQSVHR